MLNKSPAADDTTLPAYLRRNRKAVALTAAIAAVLIALVLIFRKPESSSAGEATEEHHQEEANVVELTPAALQAAGIQIVETQQRPTALQVKATGTIEADQHRIQQVSSMVSGRIERVNVEQGNQVARGALLAVMSSHEVAELKGKLLEARARLNLAESSLRRLRKLDELGAAAGKDLAAADAELQTARAEVAHIESGLASLGANAGGGPISSVYLRAPISGAVTERSVNPGAGVEAGRALFTIADLSVVWVIANVPEAQFHLVQPGAAAVIRSATLGQSIATGRVSFVDPILNEETRTGRVRLEVANPMGALRIGQFVEVTFESFARTTASGTELVIPDEAIQRIENRTVVFVPAPEPGHFEVREVQVGEQTEGYRRVIAGLNRGDKVVSKGSFTLKAQLLKGEMGEHGH